MFSSVIFLSPIVTPGLPTPGPLAAAGGVAAVVTAGVLAVVLLDDLLLLPHAASAAVLATANASVAPLQVCLRICCLLFYLFIHL
jgi:hypothetical protein